MYTRPLSILLLLALPLSLMAGDSGSTLTRDDVLVRLLEGNARFAAGHPQAWNAGPVKRAELAGAQHPIACVVTCSDSRVSPEILFDQSVGDLFVIRTAGNVASPEVAGSVQYAVDHLNVPVVIVLGHTGCGAVSAACSGANETGPIQAILKQITPAVESVRAQGLTDKALCDKSVEVNARQSAVRILEASTDVSEAVAKGGTSILTALYSLESGKVTFQTELAAVTLPSGLKTAVPAAEIHADKPAAPAETKTVAETAPKTETPAATAEAKPAAKKKIEPSSSYARRFR